MKSLITILKIAFIGLLIFGAVRSFGQSDTIKIPHDKSLDGKLIGNSFPCEKLVFPKEENTMAIDQLVQKWLGYKKLCYADSTLITRPTIKWLRDGDSEYGVKTGEGKVWTHKEPTFNGFMEFLRRKK